MVEKDFALPEAELISALFDGDLSESEARRAITLIMSDEQAARFWQDLCFVSDTMKGQSAHKENYKCDVHHQVMSRLATQSVEEVQSRRNITSVLYGMRYFLQRHSWSRTVAGAICCSILFLSIVSVWSPSGILFWQSEPVDSYSGLPIDSSTNSVSIKQGSAQSVEDELARHYLQKHQDAVLSGL